MRMPGKVQELEGTIVRVHLKACICGRVALVTGLFRSVRTHEVRPIRTRGRRAFLGVA